MAALPRNMIGSEAMERRGAGAEEISTEKKPVTAAPITGNMLGTMAALPRNKIGSEAVEKRGEEIFTEKLSNRRLRVM